MSLRIASVMVAALCVVISACGGDDYSAEQLQQWCDAMAAGVERLAVADVEGLDPVAEAELNAMLAEFGELEMPPEVGDAIDPIIGGRPDVADFADDPDGYQEAIDRYAEANVVVDEVVADKCGIVPTTS
jgi:hypothetical protein